MPRLMAKVEGRGNGRAAAVLIPPGFTPGSQESQYVTVTGRWASASKSRTFEICRNFPEPRYQDLHCEHGRGLAGIGKETWDSVI